MMQKYFLYYILNTLTTELKNFLFSVQFLVHVALYNIFKILQYCASAK